MSGNTGYFDASIGNIKKEYGQNANLTNNLLSGLNQLTIEMVEKISKHCARVAQLNNRVTITPKLVSIALAYFFDSSYAATLNKAGNRAIETFKSNENNDAEKGSHSKKAGLLISVSRIENLVRASVNGGSLLINGHVRKNYTTPKGFQVGTPVRLFLSGVVEHVLVYLVKNIATRTFDNKRTRMSPATLKVVLGDNTSESESISSAFRKMKIIILGFSLYDSDTLAIRKGYLLRAEADLAAGKGTKASLTKAVNQIKAANVKYERAIQEKACFFQQPTVHNLIKAHSERITKKDVRVSSTFTALTRLFLEHVLFQLSKQAVQSCLSANRRTVEEGDMFNAVHAMPENYKFGFTEKKQTKTGVKQSPQAVRMAQIENIFRMAGAIRSSGAAKEKLRLFSDFFIHRIAAYAVTFTEFSTTRTLGVGSILSFIEAEGYSPVFVVRKNARIVNTKFTRHARRKIASTEEVPAKKAATKKPTAKKAATKKPTAKKAATKKPTAKKAVTKKKTSKK